MAYAGGIGEERTCSNTGTVVYVSLTDHVACACDGDAERGAQDEGRCKCACVEFCGGNDRTKDCSYVSHCRPTYMMYTCIHT